MSSGGDEAAEQKQTRLQHANSDVREPERNAALKKFQDGCLRRFWVSSNLRLRHLLLLLLLLLFLLLLLLLSQVTLKADRLLSPTESHTTLRIIASMPM
jgi:hypothetical protein